MNEIGRNRRDYNEISRYSQGYTGINGLKTDVKESNMLLNDKERILQNWIKYKELQYIDEVQDNKTITR